MKDKKYHKTILEIAKEKDIKIYTDIDDVIAELDNIEINPFHSEDGTKPKKKKKKKVRIKAEPYLNPSQKFFEE